MCIVCTAKEFNKANSDFVEDLSVALVEAFAVISSFKQRGIKLDADEEKAYERLSAFVNVDPPKAEQGVTPTQAGIVEAIKQAFPGAEVIYAGTPDEVEAELERRASGKKPH